MGTCSLDRGPALLLRDSLQKLTRQMNSSTKPAPFTAAIKGFHPSQFWAALLQWWSFSLFYMSAQTLSFPHCLAFSGAGRILPEVNLSPHPHFLSLHLPPLTVLSAPRSSFLSLKWEMCSVMTVTTFLPWVLLGEVRKASFGAVLDGMLISLHFWLPLKARLELGWSTNHNFVKAAWQAGWTH